MAVLTPSIINKKTLHQFKIRALNSDEEINFEEFAGRKILLVNVASRCGYTNQYEGLERLSQEYEDQLVVIGCPCNQFLFQEPGNEQKIAQFCHVQYGISFPMTEKVKVKGRDAHDIFKWLTKRRLNGVSDFKISWNFNKFLLDEEGQLIDHFSARVRPEDKKIIQHLE